MFFFFFIFKNVCFYLKHISNAFHILGFELKCTYVISVIGIKTWLFESNLTTHPQMMRHINILSVTTCEPVLRVQTPAAHIPDYCIATLEIHIIKLEAVI